MKALLDYTLRLGDTTLVLAQRYCELVGKAPTLEEEIALANIGLDYLGQANAWLELAARYQGEGKSADDLAYFRNEREFTNYLLAELENGDFAHLTLRGYCLSSYLHLIYQALAHNGDADMTAIALKSVKEVEYHLRHQREWLLRLAHGTDESRARLGKAWQQLWPYTRELFDALPADSKLPDMAAIDKAWSAGMAELAQACDMALPEVKYFHHGGIRGEHTEKLGFLLAEMQSLRRAYPQASW